MSPIVNSQHDVDMTGLHLELAKQNDAYKVSDQKQVCMSFDDVCQLHPSRRVVCENTRWHVGFGIQYVLSCVLCSMSCVQYFYHLASCGLFVLFSQSVGMCHCVKRKCFSKEVLEVELGWVPIGFCWQFRTPMCWIPMCQNCNACRLPILERMCQNPG